MPELTEYIRCHIIKACPMTRGDYLKRPNTMVHSENDNPADEGYLVVYPDGCQSWCPKAEFEAVSRPIDNMTFGQAIDVCRYTGAKIQRVNWNGEGQFVRYENVLAFDDGDNHEGKGPNITSSCFVFHFVNRKTGETGIQVGWLASQADMSASDWRIVE